MKDIVLTVFQDVHIDEQEQDKNSTPPATLRWTET